jgi:branched-chain amino acid transport system ATP-binding protein
MPTSVARAASPLLQALDMRAGYQRRQVLYDVSVEVDPGEVVALLGHNGAGKATLLKSIVDFVHASGGRVVFGGRDLTPVGYTGRVRAGISYTSAEAPIFRDLTVHDNLELGGFTVPSAAERANRMEQVFALFPILQERETQLGGTLSGGQQRMLSLSMAIMAQPKLMMLDEPSLGRTICVVEHSLHVVERLADHVVFMEEGTVTAEGTIEELTGQQRLVEVYFGT